MASRRLISLMAKAFGPDPASILVRHWVEPTLATISSRPHPLLILSLVVAVGLISVSSWPFQQQPSGRRGWIGDLLGRMAWC